MLSALKSWIYKAAGFSNGNGVFLRSDWRARRLLILCYHGISLDDEHEWRSLYMSPQIFRGRLEKLKAANCNVLPLGSALEMLQTGSLPPRSVAITFDDGWYDFYALAWPLLRHFGYPVTVYFNSYYSAYNVPVFDLMNAYLLWKARGRQFSWPEMNIPSVLLDDVSAATAAERIRVRCQERGLSGKEKNEVLWKLASLLDLDLEAFCRRRLLHLMNPREAAELAGKGVDFQLHGHRHRVYRSRDRFRNELSENRNALALLGVRAPVHYCYPAGFHLPEFPAWLEEFGVQSAVTSHRGLASMDSNRFALPRLVDTTTISADEFSAWLSGLASWMPRREYPPDRSQLLEEEVSATNVAAGNR